MTFAQLANSLGIEKYPDLLESLYEAYLAGAAVPFDRALIDRHHRERSLFGDYYEAVVAGYEDLCAKPEAYAYAAVGAMYLQKVKQPEAKKFILPKPDGSPALDMLGVFVLLPMVDHSLKEYLRRGTSPEGAEKMLRAFAGDIRVNIRRHGRPGLDQLYFNWITLIVYAVLFDISPYRFNLSYTGNYYVLENRADGTLAVLLHDVTVHRTGEILGSVGLKDEEGSFPIQVTETETEWTGYPPNREGLIENRLCHYPKDQWRLRVQPGDCVVSMHIPAGVGLDTTVAREAIRNAFLHTQKYYTDYAPKALQCSSWLLNPELKQILGEDSNIVRFGTLFTRYPAKCGGTGVFNFVFKSSVNPDLATLPEDTRLQRALKAKLLAGGHHRNFGGFLLPEL